MSKLSAHLRSSMEELPVAVRTYVWVTGPAMGIYTVALLFWGVSLFGIPVPHWLNETLVVATAAGLVVHVWSLLRAVQGSDEFMRTVIAKRLLTAAMITIGAVTIWALFETIGWVKPLPLPLLYLAVFFVNVLLIPFINADRP